MNRKRRFVSLVPSIADSYKNAFFGDFINDQLPSTTKVNIKLRIKDVFRYINNNILDKVKMII